MRNLPSKHPLGDAYFQFARNMVKGMSKNFPAPEKCVDVVEASTKKKFDEGMVLEREVFTNLMFTPESRALRLSWWGSGNCRLSLSRPDGGPVASRQGIDQLPRGGARQDLTLDVERGEEVRITIEGTDRNVCWHHVRYGNTR